MVKNKGVHIFNWFFSLFKKKQKESEPLKRKEQGIFFPKVKRVYAKSIASELISVQPMSAPTWMIFEFDNLKVGTVILFEKYCVAPMKSKYIDSTWHIGKIFEIACPGNNTVYVVKYLDIQGELIMNTVSARDINENVSENYFKGKW